MCRGESHFSRKSPLANVGESGESGQSRLANVDECIESGQSRLANSTNSPASGHCLIFSHVTRLKNKIKIVKMKLLKLIELLIKRLLE